VPKVSAVDVSPRTVAAYVLSSFTGTSTDVPAAVRDLSLSQLRLLYTIRRDGPQTMGQIADLYGVGHAAATGVVERIERHALIERRHRADDRRIVECHLTAGGNALLDDLAGFRQESLERDLSVLDPADLAEFDRLVRLIATRRREPS
jgi:DNA-binding MarR family transcriptional regulator